MERSLYERFTRILYRIKNIMVEIVSFLLPLSTLVLLFLKDNNKKRQYILSFLLIANTLFYLFPVVYFYFSSFDQDKSNSGTILWLYIIIFPDCCHHTNHPFSPQDQVSSCLPRGYFQPILKVFIS